MDILILHGGVGSSGTLSPMLNKYADESYRQTAIESVINSVVLMEDNEIFNAGKGSYMRIDKSIQMDAAVMIPGNFGSVVNIENVKNPVKVAYDVMLKSPHNMLSGDGAVKFARLLGYKNYDTSSEKAEKKYKEVIEKIKNNEIKEFNEMKKIIDINDLIGDTVGAVARIGNEFAAAVSTGGTSAMLRGRVGDSPLPGSGIYCDRKGAIVATGIGEEIIKKKLCYRIYNDIGTMPLDENVKSKVDEFDIDVPIGIIAVTENEYSVYANKDMAYGLKKL